MDWFGRMLVLFYALLWIEEFPDIESNAGTNRLHNETWILFGAQRNVDGFPRHFGNLSSRSHIDVDLFTQPNPHRHRADKSRQQVSQFTIDFISSFLAFFSSSV